MLHAVQHLFKLNRPILQTALALDPIDVALDLGRQGPQAGSAGRRQIRTQFRSDQKLRLAIGRNDAIEHDDDQHGDETDADGAERRPVAPAARSKSSPARGQARRGRWNSAIARSARTALR